MNKEEIKCKLSLMGEEIFIKFFDIEANEYAYNLINYGQLHFTNVEYFQEKNKSDRYDEDEFKMSTNKNWKLYYKDGNSEFKLLHKAIGDSSIRAGGSKLIYSICNFNRKTDLPELKSILLNFLENFSKNKKGLVLVVIDKNKFIQKFKQYCDSKGIEYEYNNCIYEELDNINYFLNPNSKYRKSKKYMYQKEFRFILKKYKEDISKNINIGSIKAFSFELYFLNREDKDYKDIIVAD